MSSNAGRLCTTAGLTFIPLTLVLIFGSSAYTQSIPSSVFLSKLLETEGLTKENTTKDGLKKLISQWTIPLAEGNGSCFLSSEDHTMMNCLDNYCPTVDDLLHLYNITDDTKLASDVLYQVSPALLYLSKTEKCHTKSDSPSEDDVLKHRKKPSTEESWGFGFLFVTMINICSLVGAVVLPCMKKSYYKQVLIFMVGLAVGSLSASGILVLIPEALELMYIEEHGTKDTYVWRATTVMGGIYLFFLIERFLKVIFGWKERNSKLDEEETEHLYEQSHLDSNGEDHTHISSIKSKTPITSSTKYREQASNMPCSNLPTSATTESQMALEASYSVDNSLDSFHLSASGDQKRKQGNGHVMEDQPLKGGEKIATVAWMIIFGDGLHNFIDGLSIGAAFTENTLAGISISLAVICEELPHELGDFAILLSSGMSFKKALMYNFLSACMCYFGLVVGILLGENTTAHHWIFAIAGGMFLYIALVDMMPEMNSTSECEENKKHFGQRRIFLLQNVGLLIGFGVILTMVVYGGDINLE